MTRTVWLVLAGVGCSYVADREVAALPMDVWTIEHKVATGNRTQSQ